MMLEGGTYAARGGVLPPPVRRGLYAADFTARDPYPPLPDDEPRNTLYNDSEAISNRLLQGERTIPAGRYRGDPQPPPEEHGLNAYSRSLRDAGALLSADAENEVYRQNILAIVNALFDTYVARRLTDEATANAERTQIEEGMRAGRLVPKRTRELFPGQYVRWLLRVPAAATAAVPATPEAAWQNILASGQRLRNEYRVHADGEQPPLPALLPTQAGGMSFFSRRRRPLFGGAVSRRRWLETRRRAERLRRDRLLGFRNIDYGIRPAAEALQPRRERLVEDVLPHERFTRSTARVLENVPRHERLTRTHGQEPERTLPESPPHAPFFEGWDNDGDGGNDNENDPFREELEQFIAVLLHALEANDQELVSYRFFQLVLLLRKIGEHIRDWSAEERERFVSDIENECLRVFTKLPLAPPPRMYRESLLGKLLEDENLDEIRPEHFLEYARQFINEFNVMGNEENEDIIYRLRAIFRFFIYAQNVFSVNAFVSASSSSSSSSARRPATPSFQEPQAAWFQGWRRKAMDALSSIRETLADLRNELRQKASRNENIGFFPLTKFYRQVRALDGFARLASQVGLEDVLSILPWERWDMPVNLHTRVADLLRRASETVGEVFLRQNVIDVISGIVNYELPHLHTRSGPDVSPVINSFAAYARALIENAREIPGLMIGESERNLTELESALNARPTVTTPAVATAVIPMGRRMLRAGGVIVAMWARRTPATPPAGAAADAAAANLTTGTPAGVAGAAAPAYFIKVKFIRDGPGGDKRGRFVGPRYCVLDTRNFLFFERTPTLYLNLWQNIARRAADRDQQAQAQA